MHGMRLGSHRSERAATLILRRPTCLRRRETWHKLVAPRFRLLITTQDGVQSHLIGDLPHRANGRQGAWRNKVKHGDGTDPMPQFLSGTGAPSRAPVSATDVGGGTAASSRHEPVFQLQAAFNNRPGHNRIVSNINGTWIKWGVSRAVRVEAFTGQRHAEIDHALTALLEQRFFGRGTRIGNAGCRSTQHTDDSRHRQATGGKSSSPAPHGRLDWGDGRLLLRRGARSKQAAFDFLGSPGGDGRLLVIRLGWS